jgi:hypothetical protein
MTSNGWWILVISALVLGAAAGGWVSLRFVRQRFAARLRREVEELQQRHSGTSDQLRAAQVRAQTELEQLRGSFKRQLTAVAEEPRAAQARAEERLEAAYLEIDRLRRVDAAPALAKADLSDGFAATRPMTEGM